MDGVGKTTLVNQLKSRKPDSPISVEISPKSRLIRQTLRKFDEKEIDYYFYQIIFLYSNIERYQKLVKKIEAGNFEYGLSDRTFLEDIIFAEALLSPKDFEIYKKLFFYHLDLVLNVDDKTFMYLILESSFEICEKRMNERKRKEHILPTNVSYFKQNYAFYQKLYHLYSTKTCLFWTVLEKYKIKVKTLKTDFYTPIMTYNKAVEILDY